MNLNKTGEYFRENEIKFHEQIFEHLSKSIKNIDFTKYTELKPSSTFEDTRLSFDMTYNLAFEVSIRIRGNKYRPYQDLTIRSKSNKGGKTEMEKIAEGKAQIYFYAYMNKEETLLEEINICDVDILRILYEEEKYKKQSNWDGTKFYAFDFSDIKSVSLEHDLFFYNTTWQTINQTKMNFT